MGSISCVLNQSYPWSWVVHVRMLCPSRWHWPHSLTASSLVRSKAQGSRCVVAADKLSLPRVCAQEGSRTRVSNLLTVSAIHCSSGSCWWGCNASWNLSTSSSIALSPKEDPSLTSIVPTTGFSKRHCSSKSASCSCRSPMTSSRSRCKHGRPRVEMKTPLQGGRSTRTCRHLAVLSSWRTTVFKA